MAPILYGRDWTRRELNVLGIEPASHGEMGEADPVVPRLLMGDTVTLSLTISCES